GRRAAPVLRRGHACDSQPDVVVRSPGREIARGAESILTRDGSRASRREESRGHLVGLSAFASRMDSAHELSRIPIACTGRTERGQAGAGACTGPPRLDLSRGWTRPTSPLPWPPRGLRIPSVAGAGRGRALTVRLRQE